jgi:glucose-1-phosphate cytidylyltransferase
MKVVILAGGFGTRLSELTQLIPKPMVPIGGKPILWHIMNHYAYFGHKDFYIALGYKAEVIREFFLNYTALTSDFSIDLGNGALTLHNKERLDWKVTLVDTGKDSMTGGRLKRMKNFLGNERFLLTYGDGLSNVNLNNLIKFHHEHNKMVTLTSVRPNARFGEITFNDSNCVTAFEEKPQLHDGWINGGYFVMEPSFIDTIDGDSTMLERAPLEMATKNKQLMAYKHEGFWQCMDNKRDLENLELLWTSNPPWKIYN